MTTDERRSGTALLPLYIVLTITALFAAFTWIVDPTNGDADRTRNADPNPRYASQSGDLHAGREADLEWRGDEQVDSASETCEGLTVSQWAERLGTAPDPDAVAREFARRNFSPSLRKAGYEGCLSGLPRTGIG
jgi:hypothetical protein